MRKIIEYTWGSYISGPVLNRSKYLYYLAPSYHDKAFGFRLMLVRYTNDRVRLTENA